MDFPPTFLFFLSFPLTEPREGIILEEGGGEERRRSTTRGVNALDVRIQDDGNCAWRGAALCARYTANLSTPPAPFLRLRSLSPRLLIQPGLVISEISGACGCRNYATHASTRRTENRGRNWTEILFFFLLFFSSSRFPAYTEI